LLHNYICVLTSCVDDIVAFNILDLDVNLSDHYPLLVVCLYCFEKKSDNKQHTGTLSDDCDIEHLRWDHAPLDQYYEQTRLLLEPVLGELIDLESNLSSLDRSAIIDAVDNLYNDLVDGLHFSANVFIPKHKKNFFKFWWSQELDEFKAKAISSCRLWKESGKPKTGAIFDQYKKDKALYKKCIRDEQSREKCSYTNELHETLLSKNGQDFWKVWNSKFKNKTNNIAHVGGLTDSGAIANGFVHCFESNCKPFNDSYNDELKVKYDERRAHYHGGSLEPDYCLIDAELVGCLIGEMKNGRAAGLDGLQCEHLKHSHPIAISILSKLFRLFLSLGHVPNSFGASYTVPIPKCDSRTQSLTFDDFRGISISPIISKLFEKVILKQFTSLFITSDHQFGFKHNSSCTDAIYCVRNVIEHFISDGSTVNVCTLDLSKAFDRMNHYVLLAKLMDRNIPLALLCIFEKWFSISITCIKWQNCFSGFFELRAGVRQGGVLSPLLFAIFIDNIVQSVRSASAGCYMSCVCCSIFLYADDILLISPSVSGLQTLVDACERELKDIDMRVNVKKSSCIHFGPRYDAKCANIISAFGGPITWVDSCRYLGVFFVKARIFQCCFHDAKSRFFRGFNFQKSTIFSAIYTDPAAMTVVRQMLTAIYQCLASTVNSQLFTATRRKLTQKFDG